MMTVSYKDCAYFEYHRLKPALSRIFSGSGLVNPNPTNANGMTENILYLECQM